MKTTLRFYTGLAWVGFSGLVFLNHSVGAEGPPVRPPIEVEGLMLDFVHPNGKASVSKLNFQTGDLSFRHQQLRADARMDGSSLILTDGVTEFSIHRILDFINRLAILRTQGLSFRFENSQFSGRVDDGLVQVRDAAYRLNQIVASCGSPDLPVIDDRDTLQFIFSMCLEQAKIEVQTLTFPKPIEIDLRKELGLAESEKGIPGISEIRSLQVSSDRGVVQVNGRVKYGISMGFYAKAKIDYQEATREYRITLQGAKLGILPVQKLLLMGIRRANSSNIRVEGDVIVINYAALFLK